MKRLKIFIAILVVAALSTGLSACEHFKTGTKKENVSGGFGAVLEESVYLLPIAVKGSLKPDDAKIAELQKKIALFIKGALASKRLTFFDSENAGKIAKTGACGTDKACLIKAASEAGTNYSLAVEIDDVFSQKEVYVTLFFFERGVLIKSKSAQVEIDGGNADQALAAAVSDIMLSLPQNWQDQSPSGGGDIQKL